MYRKALKESNLKSGFAAAGLVPFRGIEAIPSKSIKAPPVPVAPIGRPAGAPLGLAGAPTGGPAGTNPAGGPAGGPPGGPTGASAGEPAGAPAGGPAAPAPGRAALPGPSDEADDG